MKTTITTELVRRYTHTPPTIDQGEQDIYDTQLPRLALRVRPSGVHSYRVRLGRGKWFTIGGADVFTPALARKQAQRVLGEVADGEDPHAEKQKTRQQRTLADYIDQVYTPWVQAHRKTGSRIGEEIAAAFAPLADVMLTDLSAWQVEKWRRDRLTSGVKPATVNRNIGYLKTMMTRAIEWGYLDKHPLATVETLPEDKIGRLRYLSPEEETRLRTALVARDTKRRTERETANAWRRERGYDVWPAFGPYTDHLHPLVLLALNTGLRFGELTGLRWRDVDLTRKSVKVVTEHAKSGKARHVALNSEAVKVLRSWQPATVDRDVFVFPGPTGARLVDVKTAWKTLQKAAAIQGFRFHDLRHTFASKLVMASVDLNTVRELLGHANITMTLRYSHLSPEFKQAAVERLVAG